MSEYYHVRTRPDFFVSGFVVLGHGQNKSGRNDMNSHLNQFFDRYPSVVGGAGPLLPPIKNGKAHMHCTYIILIQKTLVSENVNFPPNETVFIFMTLGG